MSILKKPYKISVWKDKWNGEKFVEEKILTIGSNDMLAQCRALEPNLTRNVNGTKTFSFKMYKYYIDTLTGEKVENPYMPYLISERKIKLEYDGKWYDFIIKNIEENSTDYLYVYQLEDALVQELSKNGFNVILNEQIRDASGKSNTGTALELAQKVMLETDWRVSSEAFVEKIEEALVYLKVSANNGIVATKIIDQKNDKLEEGVTFEENVTIPKNSIILAFYSACTSKPQRFQFLYKSGISYSKNEDKGKLNYDENNRCIDEEDIQYYIDLDFSKSAQKYPENVANDYNFYIPSIFTISGGGNNPTAGDTTISTWYRGKRYGFVQMAQYLPEIDQYVNLYNDNSGNLYYGYQEVKYNSPALTSNIVANTTFEGTSGWTGTHVSHVSGTETAKVEALYGMWRDGRFHTSLEDLEHGLFEIYKTEYNSYLKIIFPNKDSAVVNSGPYDNRTLIELMVDDWALEYECYDKANNSCQLQALIGEYSYSKDTYGYQQDSSKFTFSDFSEITEGNSGILIGQVTKNTYSKSEFKKNSSVRLVLKPTSNGKVGESNPYFLKTISLYKANYNNAQELIRPTDTNQQVENLAEGAINKSYYYFSPSKVIGLRSKEDLIPDEITSELAYSKYKPVYNSGAQKIRSVTEKESNYFNILQSIAETFGAWLDIYTIRDPNNNSILEKHIKFNNYVGTKNYASFRYGVNLVDIKRTFETKSIVTKLIVKNNSNKHAIDGFCTIARAASNPTGENVIYDFQYYHNQDLLNTTDYINSVYVTEGAEGKDIDANDKNTNLNGYFCRIKSINDKIKTQNELLNNLAKDLVKYNAQLEVASAGIAAALEGIETTREDFKLLTQIYPEQIQADAITSITLYKDNKHSANTDAEKYTYLDYATPVWLDTNSVKVITTKQNDKTWKCRVEGSLLASTSTLTTSRALTITAYPKLLIGSEEIVQKVTIKFTIAANERAGFGEAIITPVNLERQDIKNLLDEYVQYTSSLETFQNDYNRIDTLLNGEEGVKIKYLEKQQIIDEYSQQKTALNKLYFQKYASFIQEGTWISEEYIDDNKYFADAQSVLYNSCYPKVTYSINVLALSELPEYEDFKFNLGDRTYVEDANFFGTAVKEKVVITEISEMLDDPSQNKISVSNFKSSFQDLFQKITATVQQAQYSTGSYEKAVALAEAQQARKQQFLEDAYEGIDAELQVGGQLSVKLTNEGLLITDPIRPTNAIKMIGGAILLSKQDQNGNQKWITGISANGIAASLLTAGIINAGEIAIMNSSEPVFRWDSYGISAYQADWFDQTVSGIDTTKFVRFDKHGLYGINGQDGSVWRPANLDEVNQKATFALTWEGLKVTGNNGIVAKIGKDDTHIIKVTKQDGASEREVFAINNNGGLNLEFAMSDIEGQDNLLIKSNTFEYSQWKGFEYWSSAGLLDSLGNSIKKIGIFYPNGNVVSIPTDDVAKQRLLFYLVKGIKGNKYTFSFNHRHVLTTQAKKSYNNGETALGEPNEKTQNITIGGKSEELHQIYVIKQNKDGSFVRSQIYESENVVDANSYFTSTETEDRKTYEYTYDGDDGALFALGIQYSPNYSQTSTLNFIEVTKDEAGNETHYLNGNDLLISSMKLSRYSLEQKGVSAEEWAYNATDNLKGIEVGQGNILKTNLTFKGDSYGQADYYTTILSEDDEDYIVWQEAYSNANKLELTNPLTNGNYILSMEGSITNYNKQDCTDIRKAMVWLMPLYKTWDRDKGKYVISYDSSKGCQVLLDSFTTSTAYAYYTINNDIIFNQPEEGEKKQKRFVGWRLGMFRAPRKDDPTAAAEVTINKVTLERLEQMTTTNVATKTELKNTAEGLVANAYAPDESGFGWSIKPDGFYLYSHKSSTNTDEVFSVDGDGNAWISSSLTIGSKDGSTIKEVKDTADAAVPKTSNTTNFSWSFDTKRGLYMYNGKASDNNTVFKIFQEKTGDPYVAWLKGHIDAESGSIGGYQILADKLYSGDEAGQYAGLNKHGSGPAFWAGTNSIVNTDLWNTAKFAVLHDGTMKAERGTIGGWDISSYAITKEFNSTTQKFKVYINTALTNNRPADTVTFGVAELDSNGQLVRWPFYIRPNGEVLFSKGVIDGWYIGNEKMLTCKATSGLTLGGYGAYATGMNATYSYAAHSKIAFYAGAKWAADAIETELATGMNQDVQTTVLQTCNSFLRNTNQAVATAMITGTLPEYGSQEYTDMYDLLCSWYGIGHANHYLNSNNWKLKCDNGANFYVTHQGELHCNNAFIKGHIEASSGKIGGFTITEQSNIPSILSWHSNTKQTNYGEIVEGESFKAISISAGAINSGKAEQETYITPTRWLIRNSLSSTTIQEGFIELRTVAPKINFYNSANDINPQGSIFAPDGQNAFVLNAETEGRLSGTWKSQSAIAVTSDQTKKHAISQLSQPYTKILDLLKPSTFKYNDGTSDRLHFGFIAQEVENAVLSLGLTTKDCAIICYDLDGNGNKVNYCIRYSEIIPLCVDAIQQLKKTSLSLSEKIALYEIRISTLEAEVQNLKNS